jgi:hypothetical protein
VVSYVTEGYWHEGIILRRKCHLMILCWRVLSWLTMTFSEIIQRMEWIELLCRFT